MEVSVRYHVEIVVSVPDGATIIPHSKRSESGARQYRIRTRSEQSQENAIRDLEQAVEAICRCMEQGR